MGIIFNGKNTDNFGREGLEIYVTKIYDSPITNRIYENVEALGVDGGYTVDKGLDNKTIELEININSDNIRDDVRAVNKWLVDIKDNKLKFTDDLGVYYKVKELTISNVKYEIIKSVGVFTIELKLDPYTYISNPKPIKIYPANATTSINNIYDISKPTYKFKGEGSITLTINGQPIYFNVGQNLTIDSEFGECFREGLQVVDVMTGDYENLWLQEGNNSISISGNFNELVIEPNWKIK